jgi:hypothetical protein
MSGDARSSIASRSSAMALLRCCDRPSRATPASPLGTCTEASVAHVEELMVFCAAHLASQKRPRSIDFEAEV